MAGIYDRVIGPDDAADLIPEQQAIEIISATAQASAALSLLRRATMNSKSYRQPVLSTLPTAYWVTSGGLKQTSDAAWEGVVLTAEEIAVVIPIDDDTLNDSAYPIWSELTAPIGQAFAQVLDQAVFAGVNKPASWPDAIIPAAVAAGAVATVGSTAAEGGIVTDVGNAMSLVEDSGYDVTGIAAKRALRGRLRQAVDGNGQPLVQTTDSVWGTAITYGVAGVFSAQDLAVVGDFALAVLGVRTDLRFQTFDSGVITDDTGAIIVNLMQEDKTALRVTARYGYALAQPAVLADAGGPGTPFPFAVLQDGTVAPGGASATKSSGKSSS
jgi:HK97 family phage major capsid protein